MLLCVQFRVRWTANEGRMRYGLEGLRGNWICARKRAQQSQVLRSALNFALVVALGCVARAVFVRANINIYFGVSVIFGGRFENCVCCMLERIAWERLVVRWWSVCGACRVFGQEETIIRTARESESLYIYIFKQIFIYNEMLPYVR